MIRMAKMVETDHNGMQVCCSIAVVNDIDVTKSENGEYYLFTNIDNLKKYNAVFNKNWDFGQVEIHFMSDDDYWKEKTKLDNELLEIQRKIDNLEVCDRTVRIDENERCGYTPKHGVFHWDERCGTCKHVQHGRTYMQGLNDYVGWSKCLKTGKGVNDNAQERCYEPKDGDIEREKAKKLLNFLTPQKND